MENTYWNEKGKFQKEADTILNLMPNVGKTSNPFLNLFITATGLYYDVYNNGGCNIRECFMRDIENYIKPYASELDGINFKCTDQTILKNLKTLPKLEKFIDSVVSFVSSKDLSYDKYSAYFSNKDEVISFESKEGLDVVTFGNKKDFDEWVNHRVDVWLFKIV